MPRVAGTQFSKPLSEGVRRVLSAPAGYTQDEADFYYASIQNQHFGANASGSRFLCLRSLPELLGAVEAHRGGFDGDDRELFPGFEEHPELFHKDVRYLRMESDLTTCEVGVMRADRLPAGTTITARIGHGMDENGPYADPTAVCSWSMPRSRQAVVILPEDGPGLVTAFGGPMIPSFDRLDLREDGQVMTAQELIDRAAPLPAWVKLVR